MTFVFEVKIETDTEPHARLMLTDALAFEREYRATLRRPRPAVIHDPTLVRMEGSRKE